MQNDLTVAVVRDEASLDGLGAEWNQLEARSLSAGNPGRLYASHRYVRLAWRHLREPGDRLYVLTARAGDALRAVWPLALRPSRVMRLPVRQLVPIGIWEGERPGLLTDAGEPGTEADAIWAALWTFLATRRQDWHAIDLREVDAGLWPLRGLPAAAARGGFRVRQRRDHDTHWQARPLRPAGHAERRPVALREDLERARAELQRRLPDARQVVVSEPGAIGAAFDRHLAVEASHLAGHPDGAAADGLYLLRQDAARVAFYREFLPALAARGDAQIRLLDHHDQPVAALLRLRVGGTWIERHAAEHRDFAELRPAAPLLLDALAQGWAEDPALQASDLLLLPDSSGRAQALRAWYETRPTWRVSVWNLRSALALPAALQRLRGH